LGFKFSLVVGLAHGFASLGRREKASTRRSKQFWPCASSFQPRT